MVNSTPIIAFSFICHLQPGGVSVCMHRSEEYQTQTLPLFGLSPSKLCIVLCLCLLSDLAHAIFRNYD